MKDSPPGGRPAGGGARAKPRGFRTSLWQLSCSVTGSGGDRPTISSTGTRSCGRAGGWRVYVPSHALLRFPGEFDMHFFGLRSREVKSSPHLTVKPTISTLRSPAAGSRLRARPCGPSSLGAAVSGSL